MRAYSSLDFLASAQEDFGSQQVCEVEGLPANRSHARQANHPATAPSAALAGTVATRSERNASAASSSRQSGSVASSARPRDTRFSKATLKKLVEERSTWEVKVRDHQRFKTEVYTHLANHYTTVENLQQQLRAYLQLEVDECRNVDPGLISFLEGSVKLPRGIYICQQLRQMTAEHVRSVRSDFNTSFGKLIQLCRDNSSDIHHTARDLAGLHESYYNALIRLGLLNADAVEADTWSMPAFPVTFADMKQFQQKILQNLQLRQDQQKSLAALWETHRPQVDAVVSQNAGIVSQLVNTVEPDCTSDRLLALQSLQAETLIEMLLQNSRLESIRKCAVIKEVSNILFPWQTACLALTWDPCPPDFLQLTYWASEEQLRMEGLDLPSL